MAYDGLKAKYFELPKFLSLKRLEYYKFSIEKIWRMSLFVYKIQQFRNYPVINIYNNEHKKL